MSESTKSVPVALARALCLSCMYMQSILAASTGFDGPRMYFALCKACPRVVQVALLSRCEDVGATENGFRSCSRSLARILSARIRRFVIVPRPPSSLLPSCRSTHQQWTAWRSDQSSSFNLLIPPHL